VTYLKLIRDRTSCFVKLRDGVGRQAVRLLVASQVPLFSTHCGRAMPVLRLGVRCWFSLHIAAVRSSICRWPFVSDHTDHFSVQFLHYSILASVAIYSATDRFTLRGHHAVRPNEYSCIPLGFWEGVKIRRFSKGTLTVEWRHGVTRYYYKEDVPHIVFEQSSFILVERWHSTSQDHNSLWPLNDWCQLDRCFLAIP
jgi:hypothetical protein